MYTTRMEDSDGRERARGTGRMDEKEEKREDEEGMMESYLLLLLADSNLPTGGFVASAGLESYVSHGFLSLPLPPPPRSASDDPQEAQLSSSTAPPAELPQPETKTKTKPTTPAATLFFLTSSLSAYARSSLPFVSAAYDVASSATSSPLPDHDRLVRRGLQHLTEVDDAYHALTLSHVARRASRAQGVALMTLYAKAFSEHPSVKGARAAMAALLVDEFKRSVRRGDMRGHLPISFGVFCAALGLSKARTLHLHLFLHARSLLSSAVRSNLFGPYLAQRILLFEVRPLIESVLAKERRRGTLEAAEVEMEMEVSGVEEGGHHPPPPSSSSSSLDTLPPWDKSWAESEESSLSMTITTPPHPHPSMPAPAAVAAAARTRLLAAQTGATTWPLGEILQARHDHLHTRLFNS